MESRIDPSGATVPLPFLRNLVTAPANTTATDSTPPIIAVRKTLQPKVPQEM